jgi:RNA polymerase sigma-70 factor (ECF subfamily)
MNNKQKPNDGFLILQYREGNASVLPILVKRYHKLFCERAYYITNDKDLAKDIAQECWIIIINKMQYLEKVESFNHWAFRIVYNKSIDTINKRKKQSKNLETNSSIQNEDQTSDDDSNLIHATLLKAIQQLPREKQDIIRLFYAEDYSLIEISSFLKIPVGTVKSRLFKAREKLKSLIKI